MFYNFTTRVDRKNMGALKWEQMYEFNPNVADDVIPMTVADMEFKNAPEIIKGLQNYLDDAVLGYTGAYESFLQSVVDWQKKRHNWDIKPEWIVNTSGVVSAFYTAIRAFSEKGDGIINFRPVYYPFSMAIDDNDRTEVNVPLLKSGDEYTIDFTKFEEAAANPNNKVLLFCSPHNPVGRVWTKEELVKVAEIAVKYNLYVISDEIWYDFVMKGHEHTVLATVNEALHERLITCTSASKSFNLAGMMTSNIIISDKSLRERYNQALALVHGNMVGILGYKSCELAYTKSEAWLDELLKVLDTNQHVVHNYFKENFPQINAPLIEGTYVQWLDFNALNMDSEKLMKFLHEEAQFFVSDGSVFGEEGEGFVRINLALPTDALEETLKRLGKALTERGYNKNQ